MAKNKKLVIVKYLGTNSDGEYSTVCKDYGYFIELWIFH